MPEKDLYGGASEGSDDITRSGKALNSKNRNISQISEKTVTDKMMIFLFWTDGRNFRFYNCPFFYKCIFWCFQAVQAYKRGRVPSFSRLSPTVQARRARSPPKATGFFCATDSPPAGHFRPLTGSAPSWCPPGARKRARAGQDEGRGLQLEGVGRNASRAG